MGKSTKSITNLAVDSRLRSSGSINDLNYVLNDVLEVPTNAVCFLTCIRWVVDTSGLPDRVNRRGRSLSLWITDFSLGNQVLDLGKGGVPSPSVAHITTIDNARDVAWVSSRTSHPVVIPSGINVRSLRMVVVYEDGTTASTGEWEADFELTYFST